MSPPEYLCRYSSFDEKNYWKEPLYNNKIFASNASSFNDPFDCVMNINSEMFNTKEIRKDLSEILGRNKHFRLSKLDINRILYGQDIFNSLNTIFKPRVPSFNAEDLINNIAKSEANVLRKKLQIICFSESFDSDLMWSHYAKNNTGFCIRCNISELEFKEDFKPIIYTDELMTVNETLNTFRDYVEKAIYCKGTNWSYEKEWRLIMPSNLPHNVNNVYMDISQCLTDIFFGINTDQKIISEIVKHYKNSSVKLHQMELDINNRKLVAKQIQ